MNPSPQRQTILLVEDERAITEPLAEALEREGFTASVAGTAAEAMEKAGAQPPDLVLLDIGLPDGSGLDVCRELRQDSRVPIIMLTARGSEADRVAGLELGADDYIVKPFSAREVMARVRAVLRRAAARAERRRGRPDHDRGPHPRYRQARGAARTGSRSSSRARSSSCSGC